MKIYCVIVDDEPLATELLRSYAEKTPFLEVVACCSGAVEALEVLNNQKIDLLFLDIRMPELTGIEFSKMISENYKIIFTTAHKEFAFDGFKVNAVDYLLKPISYSEFLQAAGKVLTLMNKQADDGGKVSDNNLIVKSGHRYVQIDLNKVLYIENQKDYVKIFVENESEPVTSLLSMKVLESRLPKRKFMRTHRSFIVNLDNIRTIERGYIVYGKQYIPISDSYKEDFAEFINTRFLS